MKLDEAVAHFRHAIEDHRLAQAYVLAAPPRGEGIALAERILQLLCCTGARKPCGTCRMCVEIARHASPDILWIEPQSKSRKILIEQIRESQHMIVQTSFAGGWKACVLVCADRIGTEAANAFLKTLEEPPARSLFLLLTENPQFLLPTILSRCQVVTVSADPAGEQDAWGETLARIMSTGESLYAGSSTSAEAMKPVMAFARADEMCRVLKAIRKAAEEAEEKQTDADAETMAEADKDTVEARISARHREMRSGLMRSMLLWHRDILLLVCGAKEDLLHHRGFSELLRKQAGRLTYRNALRNAQTVEKMNRQLEQNVVEVVVVNCGLMRLQ